MKMKETHTAIVVFWANTVEDSYKGRSTSGTLHGCFMRTKKFFVTDGDVIHHIQQPSG